MQGKTVAPGWGTQWLAALAAAGWGARLKRGAAYAREDQVADLEVQPGQATATVADPGGARWHPRLAVRPLSAPEWVATATAIRRDPALAAALDAGEWPAALGPALAAAGIALLPGAGDLAADCPCGERTPCRHVAALAHTLAAALEADPWLLPLVRGRTRPALTAVLAAARAALVEDSGDQGSGIRDQGSTGPAEPVGQGSAPGQTAVGAGAAPGPPPGFWDLSGDLAAVHREIAAPVQPAPLLRQLGPPPFWRPPAAFAGHLEPVYAAVTAAILRLAQGEDEAE